VEISKGQTAHGDSNRAFGCGRTVEEANLDNAQLFNSAAHAESAAISVGRRLTDAGEPSEVHLRLSAGRPNGRFICVRGSKPRRYHD
jgi:hypothetical protein